MQMDEDDSLDMQDLAASLPQLGRRDLPVQTSQSAPSGRAASPISISPSPSPPPSGPPTRQPPPLPPTSIDPKASALVKEVFNSQSADFRSLHQYQVLWQFTDRQLNFINVAATGSGKTLPLHLACHWWRQKGFVSVLCQGFIVLYGEMEARAKAAGLDVMVYQSQVDEDITGKHLVITSVNGFPPNLYNQLMDRANLGQLGCIVVDEAHILVEDVNFREGISQFCKQIASIPNTIIVLQSATIPPAFEHQLWEALGLVPSPLLTRTLRVPTQRANLMYQIHELGLPELFPSSKNFEALFYSWAARVKPLVEYLLELLEEEDEEAGHHRSRGIICFGSDLLTQMWAEVLGCDAIVGKVEGEKRAAYWASWRDGRQKIICVNKAGFFGVDYANVRFVLFIGKPWTLIDWIQATGRAGRDGMPAKCIALVCSGLLYFSMNNRALTSFLLDWEEDQTTTVR